MLNIVIRLNSSRDSTRRLKKSCYKRKNVHIPSPRSCKAVENLHEGIDPRGSVRRPGPEGMEMTAAWQTGMVDMEERNTQESTN